MFTKQIISEIEAYYGSLETAREEYRRLATMAKNQGDVDGVSVTSFGQLVIDGSPVEYDFFDLCPVHGNEVKNVYTFAKGSNETDVTVFSECKCAVAQCHDPIGVREQMTTYHRSYNGAAKAARQHAESVNIDTHAEAWM